MSSALNAEADRLLGLMQAGGAELFETTILQPSDVLLDLYGEDIRARSFVTNDPISGDQMLRPDFTVPIVQAHMAEGAEPARYCYSGVVFRKQTAQSGRAVEYLQVGYELFDGKDPAAADAEVFEKFARALDGLSVTAATGDIGVLKAAISGLETSDDRRAALLRHIWRPARFASLIKRFASAQPERTFEPVTAPQIGLRSEQEIDQRLAHLNADACVAPIPAAQVDAVARILQVVGPAPQALTQLQDVAKEFGAISEAVECLDRRLDALASRGISVDDLAFDGSYGRRSLEYYDGFVFGFYADGTSNHPVASGGRYDALTAVLGQGRGIPAVGGVIRPAQVVELRGAG